MRAHTFNVALANVSQGAAADLEHLRASGNLDRNPGPQGPLGLHYFQGLPNAGVGVFHGVFPSRLHIQRQHNVNQ